MKNTETEEIPEKSNPEETETQESTGVEVEQ